MATPTLSRDVVKWLQSLDLSWQVKSPKWDFTNGYLVAEILYWYFPSEINIHSFYNGKSIETKLKNWYLLRECFKRHEFSIPEHVIDGTIHCKEDAAILLINKLYEILTRRSSQGAIETNFDDSRYQQALEPTARSNAAKALKNNLSITELKVQQDILTNQQKAQVILQHHIENRANERAEEPARFGIRMSAGQRCLRKHPGPNYQEAAPAAPRVRGDDEVEEAGTSDDRNAGARGPQVDQQQTGDSVMLHEIQVKQQPKYCNPTTA